MRTCSDEQWPKDRPAYARAMTSGAGAARTERATWVRLGAALLIGVAALVVPAVVPHTGHTGAVYTDREQTSADFHAAPTATPTATPTDVPSATPTDTPSTAPTDAATTAPASLANLAALAAQRNGHGTGTPAPTAAPRVEHGKAGHASGGHVPGGHPSGADAASDQ